MPKTILPLSTQLRLLPDEFAALEPSGFLADMSSAKAAKELQDLAENLDVFLAKVKALAFDVDTVASDQRHGEEAPHRKLTVSGEEVAYFMRCRE